MKEKTYRGFDYYTFKDLYGSEYSIQKSSLATDDAVWFGVDNVNPKIMCSDARKIGIREKYGDERDNGWCDYTFPSMVLFTSRMHLNRE